MYTRGLVIGGLLKKNTLWLDPFPQDGIDCSTSQYGGKPCTVDVVFLIRKGQCCRWLHKTTRSLHTYQWKVSV